MENNTNVDVTTENSQVENVTQAQDAQAEVQTDSKESNERTFTQEDVNNLVARETKKAQEKIFKELGFEDIKSAKDGFNKFNQYLDSQKTAEQKREEEFQAIKAKNEEYEATISNLYANNAALKLGVLNESIEDVIILAQREVTDEVTIEDAMKKVIEKYPHFAQKEEKTTKPKITVGGNQTGSKEGDVWEQLSNKIRSKKQN